MLESWTAIPLSLAEPLILQSDVHLNSFTLRGDSEDTTLNCHVTVRINKVCENDLKIAECCSEVRHDGPLLPAPKRGTQLGQAFATPLLPVPFLPESPAPPVRPLCSNSPGQGRGGSPSALRQPILLMLDGTRH